MSKTKSTYNKLVKDAQNPATFDFQFTVAGFIGMALFVLMLLSGCSSVKPVATKVYPLPGPQIGAADEIAMKLGAP